MKKLMELRTGHAVSLLAYHIILVTKYRDKTLTISDVAHVGIAADSIAKVIELNFEADHVHILLQAEPKYSPALLVQKIKGTSSRLIKIRNPDWRGWKIGYYVSSVSDNNLSTVEKYIQQQKGA